MEGWARSRAGQEEGKQPEATERVQGVLINAAQHNLPREPGQGLGSLQPSALPTGTTLALSPSTDALACSLPGPSPPQLRPQRLEMQAIALLAPRPGTPHHGACPCPSLSNAEVPEDNVQDVLGPDLPRDAAQVPSRQPQLLGRQHQVPGPAPVVPAQGVQAAGEVETVPRLREARGAHQGVTAAGQR